MEGFAGPREILVPITSADVHRVEAVARELLTGTVVSGFRGGAGFVVEFAWPGEPPTEVTPPRLELALHGAWRLGSDGQWAELAPAAPWRALGEDPEAPMRAYALCWLCGAEVVSVRVTDGGRLSLATSFARALVLEGHSDAALSWEIDVPADEPTAEYWRVSCDGGGRTEARYPVPESEATRQGRTR